MQVGAFAPGQPAGQFCDEKYTIALPLVKMNGAGFDLWVAAQKKRTITTTEREIVREFQANTVVAFCGLKPRQE